MDADTGRCNVALVRMIERLAVLLGLVFVVLVTADSTTTLVAGIGAVVNWSWRFSSSDIWSVSSAMRGTVHRGIRHLTAR